jgi:hypothetical protein
LVARLTRDAEKARLQARAAATPTIAPAA